MARATTTAVCTACMQRYGDQFVRGSSGAFWCTTGAQVPVYKAGTVCGMCGAHAPVGSTLHGMVQEYVPPQFY